ncbi:hypothetical protein G7085_19540 [Tessaracoccus sp. HDW20]|uniref:hypothetical protein n=1 Tax=Tessaracoccus coleopterorum TaxID=2714950 RepID=UPI0018D36371|nr:hypothetical protein [Tessaracoccus coleopterorum]NHB85992.1 hypothetical protein [Tessaracoccus coleopterorum]
MAGDLAWHALPFTWYTELLDESSIAGSLGFSRWLDERFGKVTTAARLTDVPGHTRGLIGPLADAGVTFLDIGVNPGCRSPQVPHAPEGPSGLDRRRARSGLGALERGRAGPPGSGHPEAELSRLATEGLNAPTSNLFRWRDQQGRELTVLYHDLAAYGSTVRIPGAPSPCRCASTATTPARTPRVDPARLREPAAQVPQCGGPRHEPLRDR